MFCPNCGKAEQKAETYCRQCGEFLADYRKGIKKAITPEEHLKVNLVLNLMTAVVSFGLAITLYAMFLGREETPFIIYLTAGFLTAMGAWQTQTFWRTRQLRKHFQKGKSVETSVEPAPAFEAPKTMELLNEADYKDIVPPSVVEQTTKNLSAKVKR